MKDVLLPALSKVVYDRSATVRKQLVQTLASWFEDIEELRNFEGKILPLLLSGLTDESPEVVNYTCEALEKLGGKWENDEVQRMDEDIDMSSEDPCVLSASAPFKVRPNRGARLLTRRYLSIYVFYDYRSFV